MDLEKGMIVRPYNEAWWYIVVRFKYDVVKKVTYLDCICDNANNRYRWNIENIEEYLTLKEIGNISWGWPEREIRLDKELPFQVITEVLSGRHDDRFSDWD